MPAAAADKTAILFVLSSAAPTGRSSGQVFAWEQEYGWPLHHRADNGDLLGHEIDYFFNALEPFNQRSRACLATFTRVSRMRP